MALASCTRDIRGFLSSSSSSSSSSGVGGSMGRGRGRAGPRHHAILGGEAQAASIQTFSCWALFRSASTAEERLARRARSSLTVCSVNFEILSICKGEGHAKGGRGGAFVSGKALSKLLADDPHVDAGVDTGWEGTSGGALVAGPAREQRLSSNIELMDGALRVKWQATINYNRLSMSVITHCVL